jgi:prevent-host-death family protein
MDDLGIRELKAKASEILRNVRERGSRYVITHRGRPVAVLGPVEKTHVDDLGEQVGRSWSSEQSSAEILAGMRR